MRVLGNLLYCDIEGHFRGSSRLSLRGDTGGWNSWKSVHIELYGDTAAVAVVVANMTPNTACIAFKLDQIK